MRNLDQPLFALAVFLVSSVAVAAPPAEAPRRAIGSSRTWAISGESGLAWNTGSSIYLAWRDNPEEKTAILKLQPSIDYFLLDHFSLGFTLGITYLTVQRGEATGAGTSAHIGGRIGAVIPLLRDASSLWLKVSYVIGGGSGDVTRGTLQVHAPLVAHMFPHFFLGVGPVWERDVMNQRGPDATIRTVTYAYGVQMTIGGWFPRGGS